MNGVNGVGGSVSLFGREGGGVDAVDMSDLFAAARFGRQLGLTDYQVGQFTGAVSEYPAASEDFLKDVVRRTEGSPDPVEKAIGAYAQKVLEERSGGAPAPQQAPFATDSFR